VRGQFASKLSACRVAGVDETALCGRHEVFEDRSAKRGRKIFLNVVVLPATSTDVLTDPLVFLAGGGVVPATRMAARLARAMPTLRRNRDIVLIDQRGSGGSNAIVER
jgi:pimeloyl-ACP methyl ester carboxylesterase